MKIGYLLAGCTIVALSAGAAMAADLARPAQAPAPVYKAPPPAVTYNWTGFYIGGDGGYGWGSSTGTASVGALGGGAYNFDINGPIAGGFVGGNYQISQFVVGVEGDWQWANVTSNATTVPGFGLLGGTVSSTVKDYGSLRGRLGVAFDRVLLFGTAGWAWGNRSTTYTSASAFFPGSVTSSGNTTNGWAAGAGVEYAFTDWVIGRVEYRYTDLGSSSFADPVTGIAEAGNKITISDVRAGLAVKFGPGPVVARY